VSELEEPHPAIEQALALGGDANAITSYYASWAESYDADVGAEEYGVRDVIVDLVQSLADDDVDFDPRDRDLVIVDAGCGTGQIGIRLAADGYSFVDGVDLSQAMVDVATRRGVYRNLQGGFDLTHPIEQPFLHAYDVAFVGGVFTLGHAPPETLLNIVDLVRPGGVLAVSVRHAYFEQTRFAEVHEQLIRSETADLVGERRDAHYTLDSVGHYFAYRIAH
jgi:SAM-dependent methyltransferase